MTTTQTRLGAFLWVLSLQFFVVQAIAEAAWRIPFNLAINPISDLGNIACGPFAGRLVCSPLYALMNLSFIVVGLTMIAGAIVLVQTLSQTSQVKLGYYCIAIAGIGTAIVGLIPENTIPTLHSIGAAGPLIFGNIGMIIIGCFSRTMVDTNRLLRFAIIAGFTGLLAALLFISKIYLGLGYGAMERIALYPLPLWMTAYGLKILFKPLEHL